MHKTITLSDNEPCRVRVLGLYELDNKGRAILGPYCYSILMATGQIKEDEYRLDLLDEIPKKPDKPENEIEPNSYEWYQLREWETYQAALAHESKRYESYEDHNSDIAHYILDNCLEPEDRNRVITPDDWRKVQAAAIVPQLTEEVIADTLRNTFPG